MGLEFLPSTSEHCHSPQRYQLWQPQLPHGATASAYFKVQCLFKSFLTQFLNPEFTLFVASHFLRINFKYSQVHLSGYCALLESNFFKEAKEHQESNRKRFVWPFHRSQLFSLTSSARTPVFHIKPKRQLIAMSPTQPDAPHWTPHMTARCRHSGAEERKAHCFTRHRTSPCSSRVSLKGF